MAARELPPDVVSVANLHAALDGIVEIETLFSDVRVPFQAQARARRTVMLAAELRELIRELLGAGSAAR